MENVTDLKRKILELTGDYSRKAHTAFRPDGDDLRLVWKEGMPIPYAGRVFTEEEVVAAVSSTLDFWLTLGTQGNKMESELSEFLGVKKCLLVNSGSSANLVAISALTSHKLREKKINKGDEVITVAAGFPTTVAPILQIGAKPVFLDADVITGNANCDQLEKAYKKGKTKAVMMAHALGNPFNLSKILEFCRKYNLWLIEDTCDALGAEYDGKKVGTFGDIGTLSFYPAHHITMGEGGAVFTNNLKLKKIAESFRDWGRDCFCEPGVDNTCQRRFCWKLGELPKGYDHKYIYSHSGFNLKITEMQAACGLGQIKKINRFTKARKSNFNFYLKKFKKLEEFFILPKKTTFSDPSWFGFPITIRDNNTEIRNNLMKCLEEKRIGARLLFAGNITKQPYFKNQEYRIIDTLENTDKIMHDTLWLGVYPGLNHEMLSYVYETISLFVKKLKK